MLAPICFSCGHVLAHLELPFENGLQEIDNNIKLSEEQKAQAKRELVDKLLPLRWKTRYCCRSRLLSYVDVVKIIV